MKALLRVLLLTSLVGTIGSHSEMALAAEMKGLELSKALYSKVTTLSKSGDTLASQGKYRDAIEKYIEALELIPEPKIEWNATTWLLTAIGDANFLNKSYELAKHALSDAMLCPGAIGNPFIHMRLGQAQFELGNLDQAADELARAYIPEGVGIFSNEDPKYLAFIKSKLKSPPGGWPKGW